VLATRQHKAHHLKTQGLPLEEVDMIVRRRRRRRRTEEEEEEEEEDHDEVGAIEVKIPLNLLFIPQSIFWPGGWGVKSKARE
jgi:hypothetical protein